MLTLREQLADLMLQLGGHFAAMPRQFEPSASMGAKAAWA
jgi:hypothetical protein